MHNNPALTTLITTLASISAPPDAINMYAGDDPPGNAIRRANLALALHLAQQRGPDLIIVGEAPGYHGARRTGVPFTSERILLADEGQFGAARGFALATNDGRISAEQTATLVYRELAALGLYAVGWNAYPLHPHRPGNDQSNRLPRAAELALGRPLLRQMLALFPGVPVVAMGRVAAAMLTALEVPHHAVRHPAQGGAVAFAEGLKAFTLRRMPG
ncbi:uracil-DNA glycosylase [Candidatus Chloroploca asiatica]|uniref:Uracil-DNA glycosylase-like domain-containing protein n=1 Tax=Candidatus Chloroploca asiatica TaxID=1506545 RepID=A0A2H3KIK3_9CHLR|nr:uracil-DNA glycosylase [Candidatus Chloroploca asiatica]PDV97664.1 hypothetical protein A9Q02_04210 [Candidatus Chloroploca asiatica]